MYSTSILRVARNKTGYHSDIYPLAIVVDRSRHTFTNDGKIRAGDKQPSLFHATPENHALLEQLHGIKFEEPPTKPTSKEIIKAMLDRGDKYVPCWATWSGNDASPDDAWIYVTKLDKDGFYDKDMDFWENAIPFDPRTGEVITELPT